MESMTSLPSAPMSLSRLLYFLRSFIDTTMRCSGAVPLSTTIFINAVLCAMMISKELRVSSLTWVSSEMTFLISSQCSSGFCLALVTCYWMKHHGAERRRRERLKAQGLVHVQGWVTPSQAAAINAIIKGVQAVWAPEAGTPAETVVATDAPTQDAFEAAGEGRAPEPAAVTSHRPVAEKQDEASPAAPRISSRMIARWRSQAVNHALHGLTAILEHLQRTSSHEGFTYAGIAALLSEEGYKLACCAEARRMSREGMSWRAVAKEFNRRAVPLPAPAKGKWTGPKLEALMQERGPA